MQQQGNRLSRINRSLAERNRRTQLRDLLCKLNTLIPTQNYKLSVAELLDQATRYTKTLQETVEKMRKRKEMLKGDHGENLEPVIHMKCSEHILEVTIVSGLKKNFSLHQVISVLEEEGAQVVSTTYHNACDRVYYTIYSQATIPRIGIDPSSVEERLKKLIS